MSKPISNKDTRITKFQSGTKISQQSRNRDPTNTIATHMMMTANSS